MLQLYLKPNISKVFKVMVRSTELQQHYHSNDEALFIFCLAGYVAYIPPAPYVTCIDYDIISNGEKEHIVTTLCRMESLRAGHAFL